MHCRPYATGQGYFQDVYNWLVGPSPGPIARPYVQMLQSLMRLHEFARDPYMNAGGLRQLHRHAMRAAAYLQASQGVRALYGHDPLANRVTEAYMTLAHALEDAVDGNISGLLENYNEIIEYTNCAVNAVCHDASLALSLSALRRREVFGRR